MDDRQAALQEKLVRLLAEAAEGEGELSRGEGAIVGVPHDSVIESRAHELGKQLSRTVQQRQLGEVAAATARRARCPRCAAVCDVEERTRPLKSIDAVLRVQELKAHCPFCRRAFFPLRETMGLEARELTPLLISRVVAASAHTRSFAKAEIVTRDVGGQRVPAKTIPRVVQDIGDELAARRDAGGRRANRLANTPPDAPDLAVIECDGGRIRTRQPGRGPGVHLEGKGWKETNSACLIRAPRKTFAADPQPQPPECFCEAAHVAKIAETEALSVAAPDPDQAGVDEDQADAAALPVAADWRPKRLVRTVLASMACSDTFGRQMAREARRRRFDEARVQAFLGDGLPWNWSIWNKHFPKAVPILDFIHALSDLFVAAKAVHEHAQDAWDQSLVWMRGCWQGEIAQVLEELAAWQETLGPPPEGAASTDPREVLRITRQYLEHNQSRMNDPAYRQQGLPVTTAWMESLVKEINWRVKGTEMFRNNPAGAEAILQVRAAPLCDDDRLKQPLQTRPGNPYTRRPKSSQPPPQKIKS